MTPSNRTLSSPPPYALPTAERIRAGLYDDGLPPSAHDLPLPEIPTDAPPLRLELEQSIRDVMRVDRYEGGSRRLGWLKRAIVSMSRPFTRRQAAFNERILAALKESSHRSLLADRQISEALMKLSDAVVVRFEGLAERIAADLSEKVTEHFAGVRAALDKSLVEQRSMREETAGLLKEAFEHQNSTWNRILQEQANAIRAQVSDQIHAQFGKLPEAISGAVAAEQDGVRQELERRLQETVLPRLIDSIHEQQALIDRKIASLLAEEAAALRQLVEKIEVPRDGAREAGAAVPAAAGEPAAGSRHKLLDDLDYYHFELKMRGDPEAIRERQKQYVQLLAERMDGVEGKDIVDVGGGSGLFAELLREAGANAEGIDMNEVSVGAGQGLKRPVRVADVYEDLARRDDASLDGITAFQVVEHLPLDVLKRFLKEAARVLRPGGLLLLETLNPRSLASFRWYFMDLSHVHFLQPETLQHLTETVGLREVEVQEISIPPEWERLKEDAAGEPQMRRNLELLNRALFGPMEYFLLARKRAPE